MSKEQLKIRASSLGKIMHFDPDTFVTEKQLEEIQQIEYKRDNPAGISEKQAEEVKRLEAKTDKTPKQMEDLKKMIDKRDNPAGITPNQQENLSKLISKRDAPLQLSKGAKSALEEIFIEDRFAFRKNISSKFIQKGHKMEDKAIKVISDFFGVEGIEKNETHYANEYTQGTPDTIIRLGMGVGFQFDVKNVYYPSGIDGFKSEVDKIYEWQGKDYNWMLGYDHGFVVKILQNLPKEMLEAEVKDFWRQAGRAWYEEIPEAFVKEVHDYFDFEKRMPLEDRIKIFRVDTTKEDIQQMEDAVKLARIEYELFEERWNTRNDTNVNFIREFMDEHRN